MSPVEYFQQTDNTTQKQYEALRAFFVEKQTAQQVAKRWGYSVDTVYTMTKNFKKRLQRNEEITFFAKPKRGRKPSSDHEQIRNMIVKLRKQYLSVEDIKATLDAQKKTISQRHIYNIIRQEGFAKLPRRTIKQRHERSAMEVITAPKTALLKSTEDQFVSQNAGALLFLPYIKHYGIDTLIQQSEYPGTQQLPTLNSILAFVSLKLSNVRRYNADDLWCMDRGLGLLAGLNVLPKAAWFSSYSYRVTREMNLAFLKELNKLWRDHGLLSDTANLDFIALPHWGDEEALENNWSGKRNQALPSILAAVGQDPAAGLITYGDTSVRHDNEKDVVIEFLDFYKDAGGNELKYLVFDSKFTTYQNLRKVDDAGIKFITIRRRGKKILADLANESVTQWKYVRVLAAKGKKRRLKASDQIIELKGYGQKIRQVAIAGDGRIKPALIITNDFEISLTTVVRKYAMRWLVEKTLSEQTHFFHLNRLSSSMVIKVDFDLTMTILAYNLYRLLGNDLPGFEHSTAQTLYDKFIYNAGKIIRSEKQTTIVLKKKRRLPTLLESFQKYDSQKFSWLNEQVLKIEAGSTS